MMRAVQKQSGAAQFAGRRIPLQTIERLSTYRRVLEDLHGKGHEYVYSHQLAEYVDVTSAQLRRDLSAFGSFGNISRGYHIKQLIATLSELLDTTAVQPVALVGAGNLGRTLLSYGGFVERGFALELVFDNDPGKVGRVIAGRRCFDIREAAAIIREHPVHIAVLACQPAGLQGIVDELAAAGVRSFLCFVPAILKPPPGVFIEMEDFSAKLEKLSFLVKNRTRIPAPARAKGRLRE